MKAQTIKSINHEVGYIVVASILLIISSVMVLPLFIVFLPILLIYGCREIWYLDHLKKNEEKDK